MPFQCFAAIMMHGDVDLCSSQPPPPDCSVLPPASYLHRWPFATELLVLHTEEPFKYTSLSSPPRLAPFPPSLRHLPSFLTSSGSSGPWFFTSAMSVSALSRYNCFSFLNFFFFFLETVFFFFFFLQGPLLMQFPVILLALSLYLNFWRRSKIRTTKSQRVTSAGLLVRAGNTPTPTPQAAKLSDSAVSLKIAHQRRNPSWMGEGGDKKFETGSGE